MTTLEMKKSFRLIVLTISLATLTACGKSNSQGTAPPLASVEIITVKAQPLEISSELPGRVEPMRVAEVRARVTGIVLSRDFTEGTDVKAGQVLFHIDPAPFKAEVARAEGQLARTDATLTETQAVVGRYEPLVKINAVSQQDFDTAIAALRSAKAARQSAGAEVETAKLNLEYATVRATISGRIGRAKVTEGALVGLNEATPMAIIQQLNPVYVDFRQSATSALRMRESLEKGKVTRNVSAGVPITLNVDGTSKTRAGKLLFSDVTVDSNTGEILMRGQFDNADNLLLPGMYVRGQVNEGIDSEAILVPQRAVQRRSDGKAQVLVVGKDSVVEAIDVQTGSMKGSEWHIINGLQPGTKVIVGGSAVPGTKVTTTDSSSTKARG